MTEIIARKIIDENGEEIIELDLNKPWPSKRANTYSSYMDEVENLARKPRKTKKEFIMIL